MEQRKYVFITGGVVSSLGKGITAASLGHLLKARGLRVSIQKLDPYLNVDPGTMAPYQHGEVFVTHDGAETDLDLGHYERFIDEELGQLNNVTSGQIYRDVINKERRGDYLGGTIQVIPHVTDEIKMRIVKAANVLQADVAIVEVGGTVGDIEGQPFIEALRQMGNEVGRDNVLYLHITLVPRLSTTGELKTKPTQHSVRELRGMGIQPNIIGLRTDDVPSPAIINKVSRFCDVRPAAVFPLITADSIYEVPLLMEESGVGETVLQALSLTAEAPDLSQWRTNVHMLKSDKPVLPIAIVGKYVQLEDAYTSVREALIHAALAENHDVAIKWINSENHHSIRKAMNNVAGVIVPGGFGKRGVEGKILAAHIARRARIPYLGLCLGMQVLCIELARTKWTAAHSTEFEPQTPHPVISLMAEQSDVQNLGGTMRLGDYPCELQPHTHARRVYDCDNIRERHRHRFEFNNVYRDALAEMGLIFSGLSPDGRLVEIVEVADHPWMVGTQFHPEFRTRLHRPHPLFAGFVRAAIRRGYAHRTGEFSS